MSDNDVVSTDCLVYLFLQYSQRVIMRIKSEQKTKAFGAVAGICGKKHILFTRVALQKFASLLLFFLPNFALPSLSMANIYAKEN